MISKDELDRITWEEAREKKGIRTTRYDQTGQTGVLERHVERIAVYLQIIAAVLVIELVIGLVGLAIALLA
ncbi:MAG: hypothetical protein E3J35_09340 [Methanomassiliicoccales archaeon]|nr:MAG: hypothetical protein E3J35_09340 [Methanomassiliicoccales archaeon]